MLLRFDENLKGKQFFVVIFLKQLNIFKLIQTKKNIYICLNKTEKKVNKTKFFLFANNLKTQKKKEEEKS